MSSTDLASTKQLRAWLDAHINYERSGKAKSAVGFHDPAERLEAIRVACETLDNPQFNFESIHVTGTNGKTSTSRLISRLLEVTDVSTGLYTSPHLSLLNERIEIRGDAVSDVELDDMLQLLKLREEHGLLPELSYFELLTLAGFLCMSDAPVDVGVVEVGVGGRFDATNVLDASVAVVTNIGTDHVDYLGPTRADVAWHKAGIITDQTVLVARAADVDEFPVLVKVSPKAQVLLGRDALVLDRQLAHGGSVVTFETPHARYEDLYLPVFGSFQVENALAAMLAVEARKGAPLKIDAVREAFATVRFPGRMEVCRRSPVVLVDGAHNAEGAFALARGIDDHFSAIASQVLVLGMLKGHDPEAFLSTYREQLTGQQIRLVIATQAQWDRVIPAETLAKIARDQGATAVAVSDVESALSEATKCADDDCMVVVAGSLYVAGEVRSALQVAESQ